MTTGPAELTASLSRDGDHLALQVSVKNASAQPLYVVDQLVVSRPQNKFARTDRPIVMNDGGSVLFALAAMSADEPSTVLYPPTYRKLAPGETFARTLRLPAPLAAWHNVAGVSPLAASAKTGVFATQVIAGEPPGWRTLPSDDAQPLSVPDGATPQLVRSAPFPLP